MTDPAAFRPYATGLALIAAARRLSPGEFRWRTEPYEFVTDPPAIDLLTGDDRVRRAIDGGASLGDLLAEDAGFERTFAEVRRPALLADYA